MDYKELSAKNVDEAITKACLELGIPSDKLDYEVIEAGSNGFLGFGGRKAVIRYRRKEEVKETPAEKTAEVKEKPAEKKSDRPRVVTAEDIEARAQAAALRNKETGTGEDEKINHGGYRSSFGERGEGRRNDRRRDRNDRGGRKYGSRGRRDDRYSHGREGNLERMGAKFVREEQPHEPSVPKPQRKVTPRTEEQVAAIEKLAEDFLKDVFSAMAMEVSLRMEYDQEEGALSCIFDGEDMGILIGKRGQTLDSLQYLTSLVVNKNEGEYVRVKLDTEDYRNRRRETLVNLSRNIAHKVKKTRKAIALEAMNPYERRIIHSALQNDEEIETYSEGEEPYRHVVVTLKKQ